MQLTTNEYLVLTGTLHGIHAITSRLLPTESSSGAQVIEGELFKLTILLTATGGYCEGYITNLRNVDSNATQGPSSFLLTSLTETAAESIPQKVYEIYADAHAVMKNLFHTPEMPIRSDGFDSRVAGLIGSAQS